jgi:hypothetical protein
LFCSAPSKLLAEYFSSSRPSTFSIVRSSEREKIFGRAIARVLAHELYHIFANTRKHTARGIGKSTYLAQELVSGDLHFEERDWIALLKGKIIANLENAAGAAKGALSPTEPASR